MQTTNPFVSMRVSMMPSSGKTGILLFVIVGSSHMKLPKLLDICWFPFASALSLEHLVVDIRFLLLRWKYSQGVPILFVPFIIVQGFVIVYGTLGCGGTIGTSI